MSALPAFIAGHKIVSAVIATAVVAGVGTAAIAAPDRDGRTAIVVGVVDGDTIDVRYESREHRVRLLNIDTPETVDPEQPVGCLGPEATHFLAEMLPTGTPVRLRYDQERQDGYGRELAGVFVGRTLVNAEIARAGLGAAVVYAPNDRFYDEVRAAEAEARRAGVGLYDETIGCTLPAQVTAIEAQVASALQQTPPAGAQLAALESHGALLTQVAVASAAVSQLLASDEDHFALLAYAGSLGALRLRVSAAEQQVADAQSRLGEAVLAEKARLEAERRAAEEAARAAAEAARRAEEARAAEEAARRGRAGGSSGSSPGGSSGSGSSGGGYDGYTGCRAYGGGYIPNAIDEQGRPYTKIDCTTRTPIG